MMAPKGPSYSALPRNPYGRRRHKPATCAVTVLIRYEFCNTDLDIQQILSFRIR